MNFEEFLTHRGKDFKERTLQDIWSYSDTEIERRHDFIQVIFPLNKPSQAVFHGYYLDSQDLVNQIKTNKDAYKYFKVLSVVLFFFGEKQILEYSA
ncbi:MAG: hypothetical protein CM15mP86_11120 [Gammaproteobacteria bacterium]|nr:MAG: hypothetical protein CM15mP86_11120 [Gammaproteobacteria bacterium]